jgi:hypothetical protein
LGISKGKDNISQEMIACFIHYYFITLIQFRCLFDYVSETINKSNLYKKKKKKQLPYVAAATASEAMVFTL